MTMIAPTKVQQKKGPDSIFIFMGMTFILLDIVLLIVFLVLGTSFDLTFMTPILYFLMMAGIMLGMGTYLREHGNDLTKFNNWFYGIIVIGILVGAILGAYMW
ncbi:MAG: hypothetical protein ACTSVU_09450 [Promethearchaeota archaeon]